jgi:heptosyltransferase-2
MDSIVVRAANWIGDAVMSLPALDALGMLFPDAEITVLVKAHVAPVFANRESVTDIIIYDSNGVHKGLKGRMKLASELKARNFDSAVLFQNAFEAALIAFLAKIPRRIGYARDMRTVFLTDPVEATGEILKRHQVYYYLNIVESMGGDRVEDPLPLLTVTDAERSLADTFLSKLGVDTQRPIVGVSPGASYGAAKRWAPQSFSYVLDEFSEKTNAEVLIFGAQGDLEDANKLSSELSVKHHNLAGKTELRQFMAIAEKLTLFLTNDSGPMHIGAALGVPTLAIFGSTSDVLTGPLGPRVKVVKVDVDCAPCFERLCPDGHYECLTNIDPKRVLDEAFTLAGSAKREV